MRGDFRQQSAAAGRRAVGPSDACGQRVARGFEERCVLKPNRTARWARGLVGCVVDARRAELDVTFHSGDTLPEADHVGGVGIRERIPGAIADLVHRPDVGHVIASSAGVGSLAEAVDAAVLREHLEPRAVVHRVAMPDDAGVAVHACAVLGPVIPDVAVDGDEAHAVPAERVFRRESEGLCGLVIGDRLVAACDLREALE
jgi:hypothetical protein